MYVKNFPVHKFWLFFGKLFLILQLALFSTWAQTEESESEEEASNASADAPQEGEGPNAISVAFGGKIQLQKEGERIWKKITRKIRIEDGDLIKTGYKSYIIIRIDLKNQIIIGSNTKVLVKMPPVENGSGFVTTLTVFEGGCYMTWEGPNEVQVFSNDGMAASPKGSFSFIYQKDLNKTNIFATSENLMSQNISLKTPIEITKGNFTNVEPDKNPTEPTLVTTEITDLLRQYFGDKFVSNEMEKFGIKAQTEKITSKAVAEKSVEEEKYEEDIRLKPFFKLPEVLEKVRKSDGTTGANDYVPPFWFDNLEDHKYYTETQLFFQSASPQEGGVSHNGIRLRGGASFGSLRFAINLPFETSKDGHSLGFTGLQGILDKIYYLDYSLPKVGMDIHLGPIRKFTQFKGLLVKDFSNEIHSQIAQPLGFIFNWSMSGFSDFRMYAGDLAGFSPMGLSYFYDNGYTSIGTAMVFDWNQGTGLTLGDGLENYRAEEEPNVDVASSTASIWAMEFFLEFNFIQESSINAFGYLGSAFLFSGAFGYEGLGVQFPGISIFYKKFHGFIEGYGSHKHFHPGYFNDFYYEDRARVHQTLNGTQAFSLNEVHPPLNNARGLRMGLEWRYRPRLWFGFSYGQNFATKKLGDLAEVLRPEDKPLYEALPDRNLRFRIFGGNDLINGLKRVEVYYQLQSGQLYFALRDSPKLDSIVTDTVGLAEIPDYANVLDDTTLVDSAVIEIPFENNYPFLSSVQSESFFTSLNASFGVKIEYGVLQNASVLAEFRGFSHDFSGNAIYEPGELVSEFSATWKMKF